MNILEILKGLGIEDDLASQIETGIKSEIHKSFVSKEQYNKKIDSLNSLEAKIKEIETKKQLVGEKVKDENSEVVNSILAKLNQFEEREKKQAAQARLDKIKTELETKGMNPKISSLVLKNIDLDSDDSDIINNISNDYSEYFTKVNIEGTEANSKNNFSPGKTGYRKSDIEKMSEQELLKLMDENPNFTEDIIYE